MLLAVRVVFTSVYSAQRKKGSRVAGQKGKAQAAPTPTVQLRASPCLLFRTGWERRNGKWVRKQCFSVPLVKWSSHPAALWRPPDKLWAKEHAGKAGEEMGTVGRKGALFIRLTGKVLQILKSFHVCPKVEPFLEISVSAHFVMLPLHIKCFFHLSTSCYGPVSSSFKMGRDTLSKDILPSAWCNKDTLLLLLLVLVSKKGGILGIQMKEKFSLWAHVHLELLAWLPYTRTQWRRSRGHVLMLLISRGFPLRSVEKEMHLQSVTKMLSGLSHHWQEMEYRATALWILVPQSVAWVKPGLGAEIATVV